MTDHITSYDQAAQKVACGPGDTFCQTSMRTAYEDLLRDDSCAVETHTADNSKQANYYFWQPQYANKRVKGNAFLSVEADALRFGSKQVTQESFLQGRGQVTPLNPRCGASELRYMPESVFPPPTDKEPWDMSLFAQQTIVPRSCASITEVDMLRRRSPQPGAYEGAWAPFASELRPSNSRRIEEGVTLANKQYPTFADLRARATAAVQN